MIIGNGDIASVLTDKEGFTFFASGVSNSKEDRESEYQREVQLLLNQDRATHLVYFSSLSIFYTDTRYTRHKLSQESLVKYAFPNYTIIRLGNITWGVNPNTLINHFRKQIEMDEPIEIQNVYRYVVSLDEFQHWMNLIPEWSCEMNITGRMMKVEDIVKEYVTYENA